MFDLKKMSEEIRDVPTMRIVRATELSFPTVKAIQNGIDANYTLKTMVAIQTFINNDLKGGNVK